MFIGDFISYSLGFSHSVTLFPSKRAFVSTFSSLSSPPATAIFEITGAVFYVCGA
jgi:hypothetical protein